MVSQRNKNPKPCVMCSMTQTLILILSTITEIFLVSPHHHMHSANFQGTTTLILLQITNQDASFCTSHKLLWNESRLSLLPIFSIPSVGSKSPWVARYKRGSVTKAFFLYSSMCVKVLSSCLTFGDPVD